MEHGFAEPNRQQLCTVTIEYDDAIRCIDLENVLSGLRMMCQHELATRTGGKARDFTSLTKIQSIEKGSIVINLLLDIFNCDLCININLGDLDINDVVILYLTKGKDVPKILKPYLNNFLSALRHLKSFKIQRNRRKTIIETDGSGRVKITNEEDNLHIGF